MFKWEKISPVVLGIGIAAGVFLMALEVGWVSLGGEAPVVSATAPAPQEPVVATPTCVPQNAPVFEPEVVGTGRDLESTWDFENCRWVVTAIQYTPTPESEAEPTAPPAEVVEEPSPEPEAAAQVTQASAQAPVALEPGRVEEVFRAEEALDYPALEPPDPSRQIVFPDVPHGDRPALVEYGESWEDGDYFEDGEGDIDLPQYHHRVITAGTIRIPQLGVECVSDETTGCLVILINHFGPTAMFRDAEVDNGFTIAGRVWDMSTPQLVTLASQALLDHYAYRMTQVEDGANCGVIKACEQVEWHVIVVGNGEVQVHWSGLFRR